MSRSYSKTILLLGLALVAGCARPAVKSSAPTREEVYPKLVHILYRLDKAKGEEREVILSEIKGHLPSWYSGIDLAPPDTSDPEWLFVIRYDLLPDRQFEKLVKKARELFLPIKKPFPEQVTRRELFQLTKVLPRVGVQGVQPGNADQLRHAALPRTSLAGYCRRWKIVDEEPY